MIKSPHDHVLGVVPGLNTPSSEFRLANNEKNKKVCSLILLPVLNTCLRVILGVIEASINYHNSCANVSHVQ